jgi:hypothetical protein
LQYSSANINTKYIDELKFVNPKNIGRMSHLPKICDSKESHIHHHPNSRKGAILKEKENIQG